MESETGRLRLRVRLGSAEFELDCSLPVPEDLSIKVNDLISTFQAHLESMTDVAPEALGQSQPVESPEPSLLEDESKGVRKSRRGGARRPFVGPHLNVLMTEKWLVNKSVNEIVLEMKRRGALGANPDNVYMACLRRLGKSLMRDGTTMEDSRFSIFQNPEPGSPTDTPES